MMKGFPIRSGLLLSAHSDRYFHLPLYTVYSPHILGVTPADLDM